MRAVIVGPRCSGKTTLFNLLCAAVDARPRKTKKEQSITITLKDERILKLQELTERPKAVFPTYSVVDVLPAAGDAERVAIWRSADVLLCLIRVETPDEFPSKRDDFLRRLVESDAEVALPRYKHLKKAVEKGGPHLEENRSELEMLEPCVERLEKGIPLTGLALSAEKRKVLSHFAFLSLKSVVWVANLPEESAAMSGYDERMDLFCSAVLLETELAELSKEERDEFMSIYGLESSSVPELLRHIFFGGGWVLFFTVGDEEVRGWAIEAGTTAKESAAKIHTDIQKGFIKAEVIPFSDYVECGGRDGAQYGGRMRLEGADYTVQDGDVIQFRFSR